MDTVSSHGPAPNGGLTWAALLAGQPPADTGLTGISAELQRVCRVVTARLLVTGSAIRLSASEADGVAACSDESARVLAELQFDANEGPGQQALATHRPVFVPDLRTAAQRWPGFALLAAHHSLEAVYSFPLQEGAVSFGVMELYDDRPRRLSREDLAIATAVARATTHRLLDEHIDSARGELEPGVSGALQRAVVYQAQGMVMVDLKVTLAEALARMRGRAFSGGISLDELAHLILSEGDAPGAWSDGNGVDRDGPLGERGA